MLPLFDFAGELEAGLYGFGIADLYKWWQLTEAPGGEKTGSNREIPLQWARFFFMFIEVTYLDYDLLTAQRTHRSACSSFGTTAPERFSMSSTLRPTRPLTDGQPESAQNITVRSPGTCGTSPRILSTLAVRACG